jgi:hypothetical protein
MWVNKDDVFADDKIWEFKNSNPELEIHIRSTPFAKSPYPSAHTRSQLLYKHASSSMSSDGNQDLAYEYPVSAIADSPVPFSQENPAAASVTGPISIVNTTLLQSLDASAPVCSPRPVSASSSASDIAAMFRQLRVHTPAPLTPDSQHAADQAAEMFTISLTPAQGGGDEASSVLASGSVARPAEAQLLDLQRLWELCRQRQISAGLIPMTQPPTMISDAALGVENKENTVTVTPHSSPIPLLTFPQHNLESHHKEPFWPTTWRDLTSIVCRPQHWQVDSSLPLNKTTKIPLKYCQPMTTKGSSRMSLQKDSVSPRPKLLKGWVYAVEEVHKEVKTEVVDPDRYQTLAAPLILSKRKAVDQLDNLHRRHCWALSITVVPPTSPSVSKKTAEKYQHVT